VDLVYLKGTEGCSREVTQSMSPLCSVCKSVKGGVRVHEWRDPTSSPFLGTSRAPTRFPHNKKFLTTSSFFLYYEAKVTWLHQCTANIHIGLHEVKELAVAVYSRQGQEQSLVGRSKGKLGRCCVARGRGGQAPKGLNSFWKPCMWGRLRHSSALLDGEIIFKYLQRPFWPGFGGNKDILNIFPCQHGMRNLRKHRTSRSGLRPARVWGACFILIFA